MLVLPEFSCVVAADHADGIGFSGGLPWPRIPADLKFFKRLTETVPEGRVGRNTVIMGRKTWDSIPAKFRPLPNRNNIVLSRSLTMTSETFSTSLYICREGLDKALELAASLKSPGIFVGGGGEIYQEAVRHPKCKSIYLTRIAGTYKADVTFPNIAVFGFTCVEALELGEHEGILFAIQRWSRD